MAELPPDQARVAQLALAAELNIVREHGLADLDRSPGSQGAVPPLPILEGRAHDYCVATHAVAHGRVEEIGVLLRDSLPVFGVRRSATEGKLTNDLMFADPEAPYATRTPGQRLARVRSTWDVSDSRFREIRANAFDHYAEFLLSFVADAVAAAVPQPTDGLADAAPAPLAAVQTDEAAAPSPTAVRADTAAVPPARRPRPVLRRWGIAGLVLAVVLSAAGGLAAHFLNVTRPPAATTTSAPRRTYAEIAGEYGSPTFTNPHSPSTTGTRIEPYEQIRVACKVFAPTIPSISPDGYWYRLVNPKYTAAPYTPATNFLNGDSAQGLRRHYTDKAVPDCPSP